MYDTSGPPRTTRRFIWPTICSWTAVYWAQRKDQIAHYVFGFIAHAQCRRRLRRRTKVIFNSVQLLWFCDLYISAAADGSGNLVCVWKCKWMRVAAHNSMCRWKTFAINLSFGFMKSCLLRMDGYMVCGQPSLIGCWKNIGLGRFSRNLRKYENFAEFHFSLRLADLQFSSARKWRRSATAFVKTIQNM